MVNLSGINMGTRVDIDFHPSPFIMAAQFNVLGVNVKSFREPLKRSIQRVLAPSFQTNFDVGGRPAWTPLSDYTLRVKSSKGYPPDILIAKGTLQRVAGQLNIWTINGPAGEAYVDQLPQRAWYGALHQSGFNSRSSFMGEVEARPWAIIQREDAGDIEEVFFEWIEERVDLAGLGGVGGVGGIL